jgi:glyoxylase-like metal-dependent hydrolase (beta-lactamase superfamily II)
MAIAYRHEAEPPYGKLITVSPFVRRIVAKNPSAFTYHGTSTYVIGHGKVAVIDPGPALGEHVDALLTELAGEEISHVLVTHTHADHSPAAALLRAHTQAPTYGLGPHGEGRYERGERVEAGADYGFAPEQRVGHGDVIEGDGFSIECVHTPGHARNHLCYALPDGHLITGDHVMGWSTSIVSPPDGDMRDYLESLEHLLSRKDRVYLPAHGPAITDPHAFAQALIDHRTQREAQVLACLEDGVPTIAEMVTRMYQDVPVMLHGAAARSVLAHVVQLCESGRVTCEGEISLHARYRLAGG